jgi:ADP-ribose pyrophosphatase
VDTPQAPHGPTASPDPATAHGPTAAPDPLAWTPLDAQVAYQGFLRVESRRYRLPDGRTTRWDVLAGGRTVALVALTDTGRVVLARQYRPGPAGILDELPGGMVDAGEDVATAAARELLEETGYAAGTIEVVGSSWLAGFSTIHRHAALARGCRRVAVPVGHDDEFCTAVEVDLPDFVAQVRAGRLTDGDAAYRCLDALGVLGDQAPTARPSA